MENKTIYEIMNEEYEKNVAPYLSAIERIKHGKSVNPLLLIMLITIPIYFIKKKKLKKTLYVLEQNANNNLKKLNEKLDDYKIKSDIQVDEIKNSSPISSNYYINENSFISYKTNIIDDFIIFKKINNEWVFRKLNDNYFDIIEGKKVYKYKELVIPSNFKFERNIFKGDYSKVKVIKICDLPQSLAKLHCGNDLISYLFGDDTNLPAVKLIISSGIIYSNLFCDSVITSLLINGDVTEIAPNAFSNNNYISKIEIENGVKIIGDHAFENSSVEELIIPERIKFIGRGILTNCKSLKKLVIPYLGKEKNDLENGYFGYFFDKDNRKFTLLDDFVNVIEKLTILEGCESIPEHAFFRCSNIKIIKLPNSVKKIGLEAFFGCGILKKVILGDFTVLEGNSIFQCCDSMEEVNIPKATSVLPYETFYSCSFLKSIEIPEGVVETQYSSFWNCKRLESVSIPFTLKKLGGFDGCKSLSIISYNGTISEWKKIKKGKRWKKETLIKKVKCLDGFIKV